MNVLFITIALAFFALSGTSDAAGWLDPVCILQKTYKLTVKHDRITYERGDEVQFDCEEGYYLVGVDETICMNDGSFFDKIPTCAPYCLKPEQKYLVVDSDKKSFRLGDAIGLDCVDGYRLRAGVNQTRFCQGNGEWDSKIEDNLCERERCSPDSAPELINGRYYPKSSSDEPGPDGWFAEGATLKYECNDNYYLKGIDLMRCGRTGKFIYTVPECIEIRCTEVTVIQNGYYGPGRVSYAVGGLVDYTCKPNYKLNTISGRRFCRLNSDKKTASFEEPPRCERIVCDMPRDIDKGDFTPSKGPFFVGDTVSYECDNGYYHFGRSGAVCVLNKDKISASFIGAPVCKPIICKPIILPNGRISKGEKGSYRLGDTIEYECDFNYHLDEDDTATCKQSGRRTGKFTNTPVCKEILCGEPTALDNGKYLPKEDTYSIGDEVTYECNENYWLVGNRKSICHKTGRKTAEFTDAPSCEPIICTLPKLNKNVRVALVRDQYTVGAVIAYYCGPAYSVVEDEEMTKAVCQKNGQFSNPSITCKLNQCPQPPLPKYGGITDDSDQKVYYPGDEVEYECNAWYAVEDGADGSNECQNDGTWKRPAPECLLKYSCYGRCGKRVAGGCSCDLSCEDYDSTRCCGDYFQACPETWNMMG